MRMFLCNFGRSLTGANGFDGIEDLPNSVPWFSGGPR